MSSDDDRMWPTAGFGGDPLTRRKLMQLTGSGVLAVGGASVLAACGASSGSSTTAAVAGTPRRGGTFQVGATGGGSNDTVDAHQAALTPDFMRVGALYDMLAKLDSQGAVTMVLAESMEHNKSATEWTIRIRPHVTCHNGKPFTATDVLYSLNRIATNKFPGLATFGPVNLKAARVLDKLTLRIPFDQPYAILPETLASQNANYMVPVGYDPKKPIGTGPFKFVSFTPGKQSEFVRFDNYWDNGLPYLDQLTIIDFADEAAQINALQSGQVQLIDQLTAASVSAAKGFGAKLVISQSRGFMPFTMRMDTAPFSDARVRQALRLIPNRKQMNDQVFLGYGTVGNDVANPQDPAYPSLPQREQDIEQAKSLLRSAGHPNLNVSVVFTNFAAGEVQQAELYATQAKAAGVNVNLVNQPTAQFFANSYAKVPFGMSWWNATTYLTFASLALAPGAPYPEVHQNSSYYNKVYKQALSTVDEAQRRALTAELMRFEYDQGGYHIPLFFPNIEAMASSVNGVTKNITGFPVNGSQGWQHIWLKD